MGGHGALGPQQGRVLRRLAGDGLLEPVERDLVRELQEPAFPSRGRPVAESRFWGF